VAKAWFVFALFFLLSSGYSRVLLASGKYGWFVPGSSVKLKSVLTPNLYLPYPGHWRAMYWEFFGFKEPPFALTPNPAFLFLSAPHQEAFAHLLFAIENRAGFIELSGEVGTGKTTIVRTLLNHLDPETHRTALIFNPTLSPLGLFREINAEFGLPAAGTDLQELHQALNAFLLEENRAGNTVVLVIDEAQNLSIEVLEQIRLISNLETDRSKLIQIVLVGQPELRTLLARPQLRQLDQRITVRYHLKPMEFTDTCDYIRHRIRFAAGGNEPLSFSPGAVEKIFRFSGGLPRLINSSCDRALLLAYTSETREISPAMAAACIADLRKDSPRSRGLAPKALAALLVLLSLSAAAWMALPAREPGQSAQMIKAKVESQGKGQGKEQGKGPAAVPLLSRELALQGLAAVSERENQRIAVNAVLNAWNSPPFDKESFPVANLTMLARQRGMTVTRVSGDLAALARLDAPALLQVAVPGAGTRLVALTGLGEGGARVVPALAGRSTLTRAELSLIWNGGATLFWKDFHGIAARVKPADKAAAVKQLQGLLKGAGCYQGPLNGSLGGKTAESVAEFQRKEQLAVDGKARGLTLLLLYRRAGGFFPPSLSREGAGSLRQSRIETGLVLALSPLWNRGEGSRSETGGCFARPNNPPASLRSASSLFHRGDQAAQILKLAAGAVAREQGRQPA
jgi:general secretion pathway protein A